MSCPGPVDGVIEGFTPRSVSPAAARFAKEVVSRASPGYPARAKALLFAASRLAAFGEQVGLDLTCEVLLHPSVIERCCAPGTLAMSAATRRTVRANLRFVARSVLGGPAPVLLSRERSKSPYSAAEIAAYLALADAQGTLRRAMRASALVCLGAGAGLMGADLRSIAGTDVIASSGGVVVVVGGRRPRVVPVRASFVERLCAAAAFSGEGLLIGGVDPTRSNVTSPLTASLTGGSDLPRIELGRLRATWLVAVAEAIGLKAFMDAAGITCSQRLGDLVATLAAPEEKTAVALLGGGR